MNKLKEIYTKILYYTVSYSELAVWSVLIVFIFILMFGGSK